MQLEHVTVQVDVSKASNVLDRWINAATRSLTSFVTQEMDAYRLYTVVPVLVKFINNLTNIYVRYNRRRLKGSKGVEDTMMALVSLYDVLLTVCKVSGLPMIFAEVLQGWCPVNDPQPRIQKVVALFGDLQAMIVSSCLVVFHNTWQKKAS